MVPLAGGLAVADSAWKVEGRLFGELRNERPIGSTDKNDYKRATDISGIACAPEVGFPRLCIVVDDQAQGAQLLVLKRGEAKAGSFLPLVGDVFQRSDGRKKAVDFDGEAVAYDGGAFYVTGSHGRPRHATNTADRAAEEDAKAEASRRLFRIVVAPDAVDASGKLEHRLVESCAAGPAPAAGAQQVKKRVSFCATHRLTEAIAAHPELSAVSNAALQEQGLSIEGLAARDGHLYAGLRTPVATDGTAYILSVAADALFGSGPLDSQLIKLQLGTDRNGGPRGIRDLARFRDGFLIIAGPANDPDDRKGAIAAGDYTLFRYAGGTATRLLDLPSYGDSIKPEAVLPLADDGRKVSVLLLFDGAEEGGGRTATFEVP